MSILLYRDYVHDNALLHRALCDYFGAAKIAFCDADDIIDGALDHAKLFVMPGGADLYYCEKLNGAGNAAIRNWVQTGGAYLGICAGAYYGCASIIWAGGKPQEITGPRELGFSPGRATGPIYEFIEDGDIDKSHLAGVPLRWNDGLNDIEATICYEGGPLFPDGADTVLARYTSLPGQPPAIIECAVGQGRAILCSPHIERTGGDQRAKTYRHRNPSLSWEAGVIEKLEQAGPGALQIRNALFKRAATGI